MFISYRTSNINIFINLKARLKVRRAFKTLSFGEGRERLLTR